MSWLLRVPKSEYSEQSRSLLWLLMPWLLSSADRQQSWFWRLTLITQKLLKKSAWQGFTLYSIKNKSPHTWTYKTSKAPMGFDYRSLRSHCGDVSFCEVILRCRIPAPWPKLERFCASFVYVWLHHLHLFSTRPFTGMTWPTRFYFQTAAG